MGMIKNCSGKPIYTREWVGAITHLKKKKKHCYYTYVKILTAPCENLQSPVKLLQAKKEKKKVGKENCGGL